MPKSRLLRILVLSVCLQLLTYALIHVLPIEMAWPVDAVLSGALSLWAAPRILSGPPE